jgi:fluoride exporter
VDQGEGMNELLVALGAAFGAPMRFIIDNQFRKYTAKPIGIFAINVLGSFLIGLTVRSSNHWHNLLAVGFIGAFTTWSTFILDLYLAFQLKRYRDAAINLGASIIFGLIAAWIGIKIGR